MREFGVNFYDLFSVTGESLKELEWEQIWWWIEKEKKKKKKKKKARSRKQIKCRSGHEHQQNGSAKKMSTKESLDLI